MTTIVICDEENDMDELYQFLENGLIPDVIFLINNVATSERFSIYDEVTFISEYHTIVRLYVGEIYYFEYYDRKVKVVTAEKCYICIHEKIGDIAERMKKYGFVMPHQSFVVNLYYVEKIMAQSLFMRNGDIIYLSQKRASTIRKQLMQTRK